MYFLLNQKHRRLSLGVFRRNAADSIVGEAANHRGLSLDTAGSNDLFLTRMKLTSRKGD
jgi:hypothetical protein